MASTGFIFTPDIVNFVYLGLEFHFVLIGWLLEPLLFYENVVVSFTTCDLKKYYSCSVLLL